AVSHRRGGGGGARVGGGGGAPRGRPPPPPPPRPRLAGRAPADAAERLCLANVVQQLEHLRAHESVARALGAGDLELQGMYFHVGEAQSYLLSEDAEGGVFELVRETNLTA
ncbi:transporter, partial [Streptomyces tendae]